MYSIARMAIVLVGMIMIPIYAILVFLVVIGSTIYPGLPDLVPAVARFLQNIF